MSAEEEEIQEFITPKAAALEKERKEKEAQERAEAERRRREEEEERERKRKEEEEERKRREEEERKRREEEEERKRREEEEEAERKALEEAERKRKEEEEDEAYAASVADLEPRESAMKIAERYKERGTRYYTKKTYEPAREAYSKGLDALNKVHEPIAERHKRQKRKDQDRKYARNERESKLKRERENLQSLEKEFAKEEISKEEEERLRKEDPFYKKKDKKEIAREIEETKDKIKKLEKETAEDVVLDHYPDDEPPDDDTDKAILRLVSVLNSNIAACALLAKDYEGTIKHCTSALDINPEYTKALWRRAEAYEATNKFREALDDLKKLSEVDKTLGNSLTIRRSIARLEPLAKEQQEREMGEVLTKLKGIGNFFLNKIGLSTDDFKMQKDPNTGSYSIKFEKQQKN